MLNQVSLKAFSEEGRWFLNNLQETQNNLAKKIKANIVIINRRGSLVTAASSFSDFCHLLEENLPAGKDCFSPAQYALDLMSRKKEAVFANDYDNLASFWILLKNREGKVIGAIAGCGGWYNYGGTVAQKEKGLKNFYQQLSLDEKKCSFNEFSAMVKKIPVITKDKLRGEVFRLAKLIEVLIEETDLKQAFAVNNSDKK